MKEYAARLIKEFNLFRFMLAHVSISIQTVQRFLTYILLNSTLLHSLEEGFRHRYPCHAGIQPTDQYRFHQIVLVRVDTVLCQFGLTGPYEANLIQSGKEVMPQRGDIAHCRGRDEVLYGEVSLLRHQIKRKVLDSRPRNTAVERLDPPLWPGAKQQSRTLEHR